MAYQKVKFVDRYLPDGEALVELKNGKIYDVTRRRYDREGTSVLIKGSEIVAVTGRDTEHSRIKPHYTIDLKGMSVLPGLFNTHCHTSITSPVFFPTLAEVRYDKKYGEKQIDVNMSECLARGITNIREAYIEDMRLIKGLKSRMAKGEIRGPRIMQSVVVGPSGSYMAEKYNTVAKIMGAALGGKQSDHTRDYAGVLEFPVDAREEQVRDRVDEAIDVRGAATIKIGDQRVNVMNPQKSTRLMTFEQLAALVDQARKRGVPTMMHHLSLESFHRGVKAGVSSLSHAPVDGILSDQDAAALQAAGCMIEPTCSVLYGVSWPIKNNKWSQHRDMLLLNQYREQHYTFRELADEFFIPELRKPLYKSYDRLAGGHFKMFGIDVTPMCAYYADFMYVFENVRVLYKNGVEMALANDAGVPPLMPAMMNLELAMLRYIVDSGLDDIKWNGHDAIRIATLNSAKSMGLADKFGSIEKGKTADLILIDGDPTAEPHLLGQRAAALFMAGKMLINRCGLVVEPFRES